MPYATGAVTRVAVRTPSRKVPDDDRAALLAFATQGPGGDDELRLRDLLCKLSASFLPIDRRRKYQSFLEILAQARQRKHRLLVMEGTGVAGGAALILARWLYNTKYVFSSGDAVAPFLGAKWPWLKPVAHLYESALYRNSAGFIGWTPYLVGRALTLGGKRAVSAAGWAPHQWGEAELAEGRRKVRRQLGIPEQAIVFGIAGSLAWAPRVRYCYGYELVKAWIQAKPDSARVLIVGDGNGMRHLKELAGDQAGRTIFLTGRVPRSEVPAYLAAMDVGSLPQSVDGVGNFRYTTKVSEYLAARLPFVTNQITLSYDLAHGSLWRLPGRNPWESRFITSLANLMSNLTLGEVANRRENIPIYLQDFDRDLQIMRVTQFLEDLMEEETR